MSETTQQSLESRVEENWGAPGFRENQKEVVMAAVEAFEQRDAEVIVLSAPTGFGKSVTLHGISETLGADTFYATPLKALQDQLTTDDMVGDDMIEIKGRSNYECIQPDEDTTVDRGPCVRESDFDCEIKGDCPYYKQKAEALESDLTVSNMSYLMAESMVPDMADMKFGDRDLLIVDECQSLEDWALNFVGTTISKYTVPEMVWNNIELPPKQVAEDDDALAKYAASISDYDESEMGKAIRYNKIDAVDTCSKWLEEEVRGKVLDAINYYSSQPTMSEQQTKEKENLMRFLKKIDRLLDDVEENDWVLHFDVDVNKNRPNDRKLVFKPVYVGRFLEDLLWSRGDKIILSSATVPKGDWLDDIGLSDRKVERFNVPSTFPASNRPIVTGESIGKMTAKKRDENISDAIEKIVELSERHSGQKGFVHCRGYNYIKMAKRSANNYGYREWWNENVMTQDRDNREKSLRDWVDSDKQIFMSVAMDEGIDLDGDKCRWQVLLKALYPYMGDERVSYRVNELNDWNWYYSKAAIQIQQAYGRGVRSEEDWCNFYVLDDSAANMLDSRDYLFEDWFLDAVGEEVVMQDG